MLSAVIDIRLQMSRSRNGGFSLFSWTMNFCEVLGGSSSKGTVQEDFRIEGGGGG